jgi:hypothetical protein
VDDPTATDTTPFRIEIRDEEIAAEIREELGKLGAEDVHEVDQKGILPIIGIVIAGVIGLGGLASLAMWIRGKFGCQQIFDLTGSEPKKTIDCATRDGRIIILAKDGIKVEVIEVPEAFDLTAVLKAGVTAGGDAAKEAAKAAGATVAEGKTHEGGGGEKKD